MDKSYTSQNNEVESPITSDKMNGKRADPYHYSSALDNKTLVANGTSEDEHNDLFDGTDDVCNPSLAHDRHLTK